MCFASGDPHYKTFDGEMIHFQGICKYTMVSPKSTATGIPAFKVQVKNERRYGNTHASYTRYVEVHVYGKIIRLGRDKNVVSRYTTSSNQPSSNLSFSEAKSIMYSKHLDVVLDSVNFRLCIKQRVSLG